MSAREQSNPFLSLLGYAVPAALLVFVLHAQLPLVTLVDDSGQYVEFANAIAGGRLVTDKAEPSFGLVLRTPLYPLAMALGKVVAGGNLFAGTALAHFLFGITALFFLVRMLRAYIPAAAAGAGAFAAMATAKSMFAWVLTEWMSFCLLVMLVCEISEYLRTRTPGRLTGVSWISSLLVLTRPVFLFTLALPFALLFALPPSRERRPSFRIVLAFSSALLPLALWIAVNAARIGDATLSEAGTASAFGVAASLGAAMPAAGDPEPLQRFLREAAAARKPLSDMGIRALPDDQFEAFVAVCANVALIDSLHAGLGLSWRDTFSFAGTYTRRALLSNRSRFIEYALRSAAILLDDIPLIAAVIISAFAAFRLRICAPLAHASLIAVAIHCVHVALVSALSIVHSRYTMLTGALLSCCAVLLGICILVRQWRGASGLSAGSA
jgi:hypothetical protein